MSQSPVQLSHVAVIDTSINDYQALVDAARAKGQAVILVSPQSSGLLQVADALAGYSDVASLSIFSHGSAGARSGRIVDTIYFYQMGGLRI